MYSTGLYCVQQRKIKIEASLLSERLGPYCFPWLSKTCVLCVIFEVYLNLLFDEKTSHTAYIDGDSHQYVFACAQCKLMAGYR